MYKVQALVAYGRTDYFRYYHDALAYANSQKEKNGYDSIIVLEEIVHSTKGETNRELNERAIAAIEAVYGPLGPKV